MIDPRLLPLAEALESKLKNAALGDSQRLFHGRGQCYPGLNWCAVDAYAPLLLMTVYTEPDADVLSQAQALLMQYVDNTAGAVRTFDRVAVQRRDQEGSPYFWLKGEPPEPKSLMATRQNQRFILDFNQQNCGFFLDMEPGRQWLEEELSTRAGAKVLNLFAYTCAFSVVAIDANAEQVINVDLSRRSLTTGRENHRANGHDLNRVKFLGVDILKSWGKLKRNGPYDIVIVDPPSFQRGSFVATKDYQKVVKRLPELLVPGGKVLACLNAPEFDTQYLKNLFSELAPSLQLIKRLSPSQDFPDINPEQQLKLLEYLHV